MLTEHKTRLAAAFEAAAQGLAQTARDAGKTIELPSLNVTLDRPRQAEHGDLACNLA